MFWFVFILFYFVDSLSFYLSFQFLPPFLFPSPNHPKPILVFSTFYTLCVCCVLGSRRQLFCALSWWPCGCSEVCVSDTSTATAMIGFRERERTRERRLSWARVAIFFLWVILVFSLISLFFSMDNQSSTTKTITTTTTTHSIRPFPPLPKRHSLTRALFHTPSTTTTTTTTSTTQKTKLDPHHTTYGDDKRLIHTGPNPLHNQYPIIHPWQEVY